VDARAAYSYKEFRDAVKLRQASRQRDDGFQSYDDLTVWFAAA